MAESFVKKDNFDALILVVKALTENEVLVGVPATNVARKGSPASNAVLAYVHEHGSPRQNIPPRPFLEPGVLNAREEIVDRMKEAADLALEGDKQKAIQALHAVGLVAQNSVRRKITTGPFASLSPRTIAARLKRGNLSTRPLIDTGSLRQAITYVLRGKWF